MAKTPKPLYYLVDESLMETEEVQDRIKKGHRIEPMPPMFADVDVMLGPRCYRLNIKTIKLIDLVEKSTRAVKWPAKGKGKNGS